MKKFSLSLTMALMMALMAPLAFADETMPVEEAPVADAVLTEAMAPAEVMVDDKMMWPPMYPAAVYINAATTMEVAVDKVMLSGSYMATGKTAEEVEEKLARMEQVLQGNLGNFGELFMDGPWVYPTWDYTTNMEAKNSFEGSMWVRLTLDSVSELETVEALFEANGMKDVYREADYTKQWIAEEALAIPTLKEMLNQKKANYELLLDQALTQINSVNLWSWVDMNTFDAKTGMATLTVSADMSYTLPVSATVVVQETEMTPELVMEVSL